MCAVITTPGITVFACLVHATCFRWMRPLNLLIAFMFLFGTATAFAKQEGQIREAARHTVLLGLGTDPKWASPPHAAKSPAGSTRAQKPSLLSSYSWFESSLNENKIETVTVYCCELGVVRTQFKTGNGI